MDIATRLSDEFAARLGGVTEDEPGSLLGIEQEFSLLTTTTTATPGSTDFRSLLADLPIVGERLDPTDPHACRTPSGIVVTADGREAEAATPPVPVRPGFAQDAAAWARAGRHEIESVLAGSHVLQGYSTHLSVTVDDVRNPRVGALYARTFAPGLMLLVDRRDSPGLIVRPRPGRVELCGEFVEGPWLRAASVFAVGSVLATHDVIRGSRSWNSLPPQLRVALRPASARAGWFVDRAAFGSDLLASGRSARLLRCDGRRVGAQEHLERAWTAARAALASRVSPADLDVVDAIVGGRCPLPRDAHAADLDAVEPGPLPPPSPLGAVGEIRVRAGFVVEAVAATWRSTVFRVRSRGTSRDAFVAVPRAHHARFFRLLDTGGLDRVLDDYLALAPADRPLAMVDGAPSIGDLPPSGEAVAAHERDRDLAVRVPGLVAREAKVLVPGVAEPVLVSERRGCLPGAGWLVAGGVVVALVIGGLVLLLSGGGGEGGGSGAGSSGAGGSPGSLVACGARTTGAVLEWKEIMKPCAYDAGQLSGISYRYDPRPFRRATVATSTPVPAFAFGTPCARHDLSKSELQAGADPITGFVGPSLIEIPIAGLPPGSLVEVVLQAPGEITKHTGVGTADAAGYALVKVPIDLAVTHTIVGARYFPGGKLDGPSTEIDPASISPSRTVSGAKPGSVCDRAATLALVPAPAPPGAAHQRAKTVATDTASVFALLIPWANPAADADLRGPYEVMPEDDYIAMSGGGVSFEFMPGTGKALDRVGEPPVVVRYFGGTVLFPSSAGTGDAWSTAFPCGSGQLALTVCAPQHTALRDVAYAKVGAVFDQAVPLQPKTDVWYRFSVGTSTIDVVARGGRWSLTGSPDARAFIRNDVVFVVAPMDEVGTGAYRVATSAGGHHDVQPPASVPALPLETTVQAHGVPGRETAAQFVVALSAAFTGGDAKFLRSRMHPAVIDRYGSAACDAYAAGPHAATAMTLQSMSPGRTFTWQSDGLSRDVPDTNTAVTTDNGQSESIHIALVDGQWRWFADCGAPRPGAR